MRALILIAGALVLAGCGNNDQSDNTANVDENLSAENIVSNDVTAIDAVTGEAANMAADVDVNFTNEQQLANGSNPAPPSTSPSHPPAQRSAQPKTVTPPASQPVSNATSNAAQ